MSTSIYPKKRLPNSVSLGITNQLAENESLYDHMFSSFSKEKQEAILFKTNHMAFVCRNEGKTRTKKNELIVFLAVRRALAMKNHTKLPVYLVVKSKHVGKQVAVELARHSTDYKLYNMITSLRNKLNKELLEKTRTEADFILITYHKLRELVFLRANPSTEHIVFVNPLTTKNGYKEVIAMDDIIGGLHRHKYRKPHFTFLIDTNSFPIMQKKDYQYLLNVEECLFFGCKETPMSSFNNKLRNTLEHLNDEHIQFSILRELFRRKSLLDGLDQRFKESITYKLHLFSNNIYPQYIEQKDNFFTEEVISRKTKIDKKIYGKLSQTLTLFNKKKTTMTIIGKKLVEIFDQEKTKYSWEDPIETPPFLPLIEKNQDKKYALTSLGLALLIGTSNFSGVKIGLTAFLFYVANILYRNKRFPVKLTIGEIVNCYSKLIGADPIYLPTAIKEFSVTETIQSEEEKEELIKSFNYFIEREFGYIMNDYTSYAALTLLGAFEELMDENALYFYERLKDFKEKKEQKREFNLTEAIFNTVKNKPLMIREVSQKVKVEYKVASKELKKLETQGQITSIKTVLNDGFERLKYCQPEVLELFPYLKKTCGICAIYKRRFQNCPLLELLAIFNTTNFPMEYIGYICNIIKEYATACEHIVEYTDLEVEGEKIRYTKTKEDLEQKRRVVNGSYLLGQEVQTKYLCATCEDVIEEFGTGEEIFFPRRRILCPNCSTGYYLKDDGRILIQTEHRDILRQKYYEVAGSIPKILKEAEPSYAYVIYDQVHANVVILEDGSLVLEICDHRVPLEKIQYIYFAGQEHKELEGFLKKLLEVRPDRFKYTINRSQQKEEEDIELREGCEPFTSEQYQGLHKFVGITSEEELCNSTFLKARQLSNIGALLKHQKTLQEKNKYSTKVNKQLKEMFDLLLIVQTGINSSYYGRQLEGLSQNCLFDLIKEVGGKAGLWTHGRVISRLVKDIFLSSTMKISNARAPLDALLNQIFRQFRFKVNKVFRKIGWEPSSLGPGLIHKRKTKSDIDRKGFYFDIIEPVGSLALMTLLNALTDGLFSDADCSLELDGSGQEIYRVKNSSIEKIELLVDEALAEHVFYKGVGVPFLEAFEENLLKLRQAVELWFQISDDGKEPTSETISQCMNAADYFPLAFCPDGCEEELTIINNFTKKYSCFFEGREKQVLAAKKKRQFFRIKAKKKWLISNGKRGKEKLQLTKHQAKEHERSLLVVLVMLQLGFHMNGFFGYYSTNHIRELLLLTQNQAQRILTKMVTQGLLLK